MSATAENIDSKSTQASTHSAMSEFRLNIKIGMFLKSSSSSYIGNLTFRDRIRWAFSRRFEQIFKEPNDYTTEQKIVLKQKLIQTAADLPIKGLLWWIIYRKLMNLAVRLEA